MALDVDIENPVEPDLIAADTRLVNWALHLPASKRLQVEDRGEVAGAINRRACGRRVAGGRREREEALAELLRAVEESLVHGADDVLKREGPPGGSPFAKLREG